MKVWMAIAWAVSLMAGEHTCEDDRIRVQFPSDLIATHPARVETMLTVGKRLATKSVLIPGVKLSKGRFQIYLLSHNQQASGIIGGRFSEIAPFAAPWMKVEGPSGCIEAFSKSMTPVSKQLVRVDLYLDPKLMARAYEGECRHLHSKTRIPVWSGSYFGLRDPAGRLPGYFLVYPIGKQDNNGSNQMVFTVTMDTKDAESLPAEDDRDLLDFLQEASEVVSHVHYKSPP